jgi:hypothetical protein
MADIRILLTDKTIAQLPNPDDGWYLARDTELKGFFVVVGKRKRTFTVQGISDREESAHHPSEFRLATPVKCRRELHAQSQKSI